MNKLLLVLSCFLGGLWVHAQGKSMANAIDVKHVALEMHVDFHKHEMQVVATIELDIAANTDQIIFCFDSLRFIKVLCDGKDSKFYIDKMNEQRVIKVIPKQKLIPGHACVIQLNYIAPFSNVVDATNLSGSNGSGLRFNEPTANDTHAPYELYTIGDMYNNRYWFPLHCDLSDVFTTTYTAIVDSSFTVLCNGELQSAISDTHGKVLWEFRDNDPHALHLNFMVIGEYYDYVQKYNGKNFHTYGYKNERAETEATAVQLTKMAAFFTDYAGKDFPYNEYTQVAVQYLPGFINYKGTSLITENMIDDKVTHDEFFYLWDLTEAEALASQWFGAYLHTDDWSEIWLVKSLAHYMSLLYNEHANGTNEMLCYALAYDKGNYLADWQSNVRFPIKNTNYSNLEQYHNSNHVTAHGAEVWHMLRKEIGDTVFKQVIRKFVARAARGACHTKQLMEVVNEVTASDYTWFFKQWIFGIGHPIFDIQHQYNAQERKLVLTILQQQHVDSTTTSGNPSYFKGHVDVAIDNRLHRVWLQPQKSNSITLSITTEPRCVNFDFQNTWIKELTYNKSGDELMYQLEHDSDYTARYWALGQLQDKWDAGEWHQMKQPLVACLTRLVQSKSYWRFRISCMGWLRTLYTDTASSKLPLDEPTREMLLVIIRNDSAWVKASAVSFLGATTDSSYIDLYKQLMYEESERVAATAAMALARTKCSNAFELLAEFAHKPSMKSQSLLSALSAMKVLNDTRVAKFCLAALTDTMLPRWRLPNGSIWDYRVVAVQNIAASPLVTNALQLLHSRIRTAAIANDYVGFYNNLLLLSELATANALATFGELKNTFGHDKLKLDAINHYELILKNKLKQ